MSESQRVQRTILSEVIAHLPPNVRPEDVSGVAELSVGISSALGQTLLVRCRSDLFVFARKSRIEPFRSVALAGERRIRREQGDLGDALILRTADGHEHRLRVTLFDWQRIADGLGDIESLAASPRNGSDAPSLAERSGEEPCETVDAIDLAIEQQQELLQRDPTQVAAHRALFPLYWRRQMFDAAWCTCSALALLRGGNDHQQKFYEDHRPRGIPHFGRPLDNEMWRKLVVHPDEDRDIGLIFEMLTNAALQAKIRQLQAAKQLPVLDKRFKQEPQTTTVTFAKTFFHIAKVLGVTPPELYVHTNIQGGLTAAPVLPAASVAGQSVLSGFSPLELSFIVAKHLSNYRGENYIKNVFATQTELTQLFFAGLRMVLPDAPVPAEMAQNADVTAKALAPFMQPQHQEGLRHVARKFMETKAAIDIKRWLQSTELTACRAGLVACGDLEVAKKILLIEPQVPGDLSPQDKITELIVFSVSSEYFAVRKALGVTIG